MPSLRQELIVLFFTFRNNSSNLMPKLQLSEQELLLLRTNVMLLNRPLQTGLLGSPIERVNVLLMPRLGRASSITSRLNLLHAERLCTCLRIKGPSLPDMDYDFEFHDFINYFK
jgi:hypothetical protein